MTAYYSSNKIDDDPILESSGAEVSTIIKSQSKYLGLYFFRTDLKGLLSVTLDQLTFIKNQTKNTDNNTPKYVLPFDPLELMRFRSKKQLLSIVQSSLINLPSGAGIYWMTRFLRKPIKGTITVKSYVMALMRLCEAKSYTVFLIGGSRRGAEKLFFNLKHVFPHLLIVGRQHRNILDNEGALLCDALRKMNPNVILMDMGQQRGLRWLKDHKKDFGNAIVIHLPGKFDVLAGVEKPGPEFFGKRNLIWLWRILSNPFRWYKLIFIFQWLTIVFFKRITKS